MEQQAGAARYGVMIGAVMSVITSLAGPLQRLRTKIFTQVRDECYVVGRQLRNSAKGLQAMQETATTVEQQLQSLTRTF